MIYFMKKKPPYGVAEMREKTEQAIEYLIKQDGVLYQLVKGESLTSLEKEAEAILSDENQFKKWLNAVAEETLAYAENAKVIKKK